MATIIWELRIGDVFRVDTLWYRLQKIHTKNAVLEVLGTKETATLPLDTEITELSVLSKK